MKYRKLHDKLIHLLGFFETDINNLFKRKNGMMSDGVKVLLRSTEMETLALLGRFAEQVGAEIPDDLEISDKDSAMILTEAAVILSNGEDEITHLLKGGEIKPEIQLYWAPEESPLEEKQEPTEKNNRTSNQMFTETADDDLWSWCGVEEPKDTPVEQPQVSILDLAAVLNTDPRVEDYQQEAASPEESNRADQQTQPADARDLLVTSDPYNEDPCVEDYQKDKVSQDLTTREKLSLIVGYIEVHSPSTLQMVFGFVRSLLGGNSESVNSASAISGGMFAEQQQGQSNQGSVSEVTTVYVKSY